MRLKVILILIIIIIIISSFCSCSPKPKRLLKWSLDFVNDPVNQNENFGFGRDCSIKSNLLVCVRSNGYMLGIDKNTGKIKWSYHSDLPFQRTPLIIDNKIFNINHYGTLSLTVLNLEGDLLYEKEFNNYEGTILYSIPTYDTNNIYFVIIDSIEWRRKIFSINIQTYEYKIVHDFSGSHGARIVSFNDILYIPYDDNKNSSDQSGIIAYDLLNEEEKWKTSFGELNGISNYNPIIYNGKMYVQVQCYTKELDLETGEVLRTFIESCGNNGMSAVDNILFHPDWLDAFDLNTGELLWSQDALYTMDSGSVYHDGVFYVMFYGLVALDADNGKYLIKPNPHDGEGPSWEYDNQSGMPLLDDGVIYVNGLRGIYAFNTIGND